MTFKGIELLNYEEKLALFYGIMLGDGCLSYGNYGKSGTRHTICVVGSIYDDKPFFETIVIPLVKDLTSKEVKFHERPRIGCIDLRFDNPPFFYKLKGMGFIVGRKGPKISVPKNFLDYNLMVNIIRGFMATDGSLVLTKNPNKFYPRIEANGISKPLILQIYKFLYNVGLKGSFYKAIRLKVDPRFKIVQDKYRFQFNGSKNLELFCDKIGFINPKHISKLSAFYQYSQKYDTELKNTNKEEKIVVRASLNSHYYNIWR